MNFALSFLAAILYPLTLTTLSAEFHFTNPEDWKSIFNELEVEGTIVIADERKEKPVLLAHNSKRAGTRFSPASTFKLPHTLFALDAGIVRDEFQTFTWDEIERFSSHWNKDQNLRSSIQHSVVWVFEGFAEELGEKREHDYLSKINYGNSQPTGKKPFWINGDLKISATEQITFLQNLYHNKLPFDPKHLKLLKDLMILESETNWILRGKTGWNGKLAWWVGWLETPSGTVFFATNLDTPKGKRDLAKREQVTRAILRSIKALPKTHE